MRWSQAWQTTHRGQLNSRPACLKQCQVRTCTTIGTLFAPCCLKERSVLTLALKHCQLRCWQGLRRHSFTAL